MATIEICDICHTSKDVKRVYLCYDRTSNGAPSIEIILLTNNYKGGDV